MFSVRGLRGATTADANSKEAIVGATTELLQRLVEANNLNVEDIAAAFFTTTEDLNAEFPAVAARLLGWESVALIDAHEMKVPDSQPMCIRVLLLVNTNKASKDMHMVYLKGAARLRDRGKEGS